MKKVFSVFLALIVSFTIPGCQTTGSTDTQSTVSQGRLNILGSYHEDMVKSMAEMYGAKYGVEVSYIRMPTQDAEARLLAEQSMPTCDVWIGGTVDAHELLKERNVLTSCTTEEEANIPEIYLDPDGVWKTQYVEIMSIGINTDRWEAEFEPLGLKKPETLSDLLAPEYRGEIIIPDPSTSGTGYTFLSSVLSDMGEEEGWKYLEALNTQVGQYTYSGYTASEKVGLGEYLICLNFLSDQLLVKSYGYPVESIMYDEAGWTAVPVSLVTGAPNRAEAERFLNFCLSSEACSVLVGLGNVLPVREDLSNFPEGFGVSELKWNKSFSPISDTEEKSERISRFLELMP